MFRTALIVIVTTAISLSTFAQKNFSAGLGVNYISNTYDAPHLYDYFVPSINLSYCFLPKSKFGLAIESVTTVRSRESDNERKSGFTSSLPVIASLNLKRINLYIGSGPSYVEQKIENNMYYEKASGYYLNNLVGVGFKGKSVLSDAVYPEYNIRWSYLKGLGKSTPDGAMISFIMFLRG